MFWVVCRPRVPLFEFSLMFYFLKAYNPASLLTSLTIFSSIFLELLHTTNPGQLPNNWRAPPPKMWLSTTELCSVWGSGNGHLPTNTCNCHQDNCIRQWDGGPSSPSVSNPLLQGLPDNTPAGLASQLCTCWRSIHFSRQTPGMSHKLVFMSPLFCPSYSQS